MSFNASGVTQVYYAVYMEDGSATVDPSTSYTLTLEKNSGANNGLAGSIGSRQMNVQFATSSASPTDLGFNVLRAPFQANPTFAQANSSLIPLPGTLSDCPGVGCSQYIDSGLYGGTLYVYQLQIKHSNNSVENYGTMFTGYTQPTTDDPRDRDGDGFEDGVELRYGSDPLSAGSQPPSGFPYNTTGDADGDGYKDNYEYALGFDPLSSASHPNLGDLNGDGVLTGADAIILKRIAAGTLSSTNYPFSTQDTNRDGVVNGSDATILKQRVVKTITVLP